MRPPVVHTKFTRGGINVSRFVWKSTLVVLGLTPIAIAAVTPRLFTADYSSAAPASSLAALFGRAGTAILIAVAAAAVLVGGGRLRLRPGRSLVVGALALFAGTIASSFGGIQPEVTVQVFLVPLCFLGLYLVPTPPPDWIARRVRVFVLVYAYGSLISVVVAPFWALEPNYLMSSVPGLFIRLHGVATHANNLAAILAFYFLLPPDRTSRSRYDWLNLLVVLVALFLTQSKTINLVLATVLIIHGMRLALRLSGARRYLALAVLSATLLIGLAGLAVEDYSLLTFSEEPSAGSIQTLTGRTAIWSETYALWTQNPVFGYGPNLWGPEMRRAYLSSLGWAPPHAHNQFFQTLGESGLIGVAGLAIYLLVLVRYGWRYSEASRGVTLYLVLAMMLRGITEPPFRIILFDGTLFLHVAMYGYLLAIARRSSHLSQETARVERTEPLLSEGRSKNSPEPLRPKIIIKWQGALWKPVPSRSFRLKPT